MMKRVYAMKKLKRLSICIAAMMFSMNMLGVPGTAQLQNCSERTLSAYAAESEKPSVWDGTVDTSWYDSEETEFHLSTAEELAGFASIVNGGKSMKGQTIYLEANIDINPPVDTDTWSEKAPANIWNSINKFSGTFDGQNHAIRGLYTVAGGLFGTLDGGTICNLSLKSAFLKASVPANSSTLTEASFLCTRNEGGTISECRTEGDAIGNNNTVFGSICGVNQEGTIRSCTSGGKITTPERIVCIVGGICGSNKEGSIEDCVNAMDISASTAGGVVGASQSSKTLSKLSNIGTISGATAAGILATANTNLTLSDCTNNGQITGTKVGGIVAEAEIPKNTDGVFSLSGNKNSGTLTGDSASGIIASATSGVDTYYEQGDSPYSGTLTLTENLNFGDITSKQAGGICGYTNVSTLTVTQCGNEGILSGGNDYAGGIIGKWERIKWEYSYTYGRYSYRNPLPCEKDFSGTITFCYNKGEIQDSNSNYAGGIIGTAYDAYDMSGNDSNYYGNHVSFQLDISDSYNTAKVSGQVAGGITGNIYSPGYSTYTYEVPETEPAPTTESAWYGNNTMYKPSLNSSSAENADPIEPVTEEAIHVSQPSSSAVFAQATETGYTYYGNYSLKNVYSASAKVTGSEAAGGLIGSASVKGNTTVENCYYLSSGASKGIGNSDSDIGITKSATNMKKAAFADSMGSSFLYEADNFPVLFWEKGIPKLVIDKTEISLTELGQQDSISVDTTYDQPLTWTSDNESIATVDENGVITAVGNGTCKITVSGGGAEASCVVSCAYDYYLKEKSFTLNVDKSKTISVLSKNTNKPVNAPVSYTSDNPDIADVDEEGIVSANSVGTTTIHVYVGDIELTFEVTVNTIKGDINADGEFSLTDVVAMQKWLHGHGSMESWQAGDLNQDEVINVFDFVLMKRLLFK